MVATTPTSRILDSVKMDPSPLGTKEYWDSFYATEKDNFIDHGDEGEVWFGISVEKRIVSWISKNVPKFHSLCDLGTGNGHMLLSLKANGFSNLCGLDYSQNSLDLARNIVGEEVRLKLIDLLQDTIFEECFDLVIDKGTWDAISLNPSLSESRLSSDRISNLFAKYYKTLVKLVKDNGFFLITSCNFTKDELVEMVCCFKEFRLTDEIIYPTYTFGGQTGQAVTTLVFQKST